IDEQQPRLARPDRALREDVVAGVPIADLHRFAVVEGLEGGAGGLAADPRGGDAVGPDRRAAREADDLYAAILAALVVEEARSAAGRDVQARDGVDELPAERLGGIRRRYRQIQ